MEKQKNLADRIFGGVIVAVGVVCIAECVRLLPMANSALTGDHIMPGITGAALCLLGLVMLIRPGKRQFSVAFPEQPLALRMLGTLGILAAYAAGVEWIGFAASTAICGVFLYRLFGGYAWAKCVLISAVTTAGLYAVFVYGLGMSFPRGFWG